MSVLWQTTLLLCLSQSEDKYRFVHAYLEYWQEQERSEGCKAYAFVQVGMGLA